MRAPTRFNPIDFYRKAGKPLSVKAREIKHRPVTTAQLSPVGHAFDKLSGPIADYITAEREKKKATAARAEMKDVLSAYYNRGGQPAYDAVANAPMDMDETSDDVDRDADIAFNKTGGIEAVNAMDPSVAPEAQDMRVALMVDASRQRQAREERDETRRYQEGLAEINAQRAKDLKGSPDGKVVPRKTGKDQNGVMRYIDNGERVYPAVKVAVDPKAEYTLGDDGSQKLTRKGKERFEEKWRTRIKPQVDQLQEVDRKLRIVNKALDQKTGTADIAAINAYQRMLDEGVVRGEDITTQASAKSAYDTVTLWLANKKEGDLLPQPVRDKMRTMANILSRQTVKGISTTLNSWREVVLDTSGLEWKNIMPLGLDAFLTTGMTEADKEALNWAKKNPNDPRAIEAKKRLGIR